MKKILFSLFITQAFLLTSCSSVLRTYLIDYNMNLEVDKPDKTKELAVLKQKVVLFDEKKDFSFSDKNIDIHWKLSKKGFKFTLKNKTNSVMKVLWQDSAFADEYSISQSLMNYENIYNEDKIASIILPSTFIEDMVTPDSYVKYSNRGNSVSFGNYFPSSMKTSGNYDSNIYDNLKDIKERFKDKDIKILMPIEIDNKINNYIFTFKINDVDLDLLSEDRY